MHRKDHIPRTQQCAEKASISSKARVEEQSRFCSGEGGELSFQLVPDGIVSAQQA